MVLHLSASSTWQGLKRSPQKLWVQVLLAQSLPSVSNDPKNPKINDQPVKWKFYADEDRITATPEHAGGIIEEPDEILEENTEHEYRGEDGNIQPDSGISTLLESSPASPWRPPDRRYGSRLPSALARARPTLKAEHQTTLKAAYEGRDGLPWWRHLAPCNAGIFSRSSRKHGSGLTSSSSQTILASMPPSATECEILQPTEVKVFSYNDLRLATKNFRPDSMIGEGQFGSVYKGWIDEHTFSSCHPCTGMVVAVKKLNLEGLQGHHEWLADFNYIGQFCHPNLVKLIGYCLEGEHLLLVYEFMPRGSLEGHLFRRGSHFQPLSWNLRMKVALGAAKGLAHLHGEEVSVIYRDFKTSNILLDTDYTAKLSDFGLVKHGPAESPVSTRAMGSYGYAAPENVSTGNLYAKSDIYGFRVVLLEMLSGRRAIDKNRLLKEHNLVEWARPYLTHKRRISHVLDAKLEGQYPLGEARRMAALAAKCLCSDPNKRPSMDTVVSILEEIQSHKSTHRQV